MEITKTIYLEPLKSVPGRSIFTLLTETITCQPMGREGGGDGVKSFIYIHLLFVKKIKK